MAVIFPFEANCYADTALPVEFVGHPFIAAGHATPVTHDPTGPVLLLPGSRQQAVARIFPALLAGFADYARDRPGTQAVVLYPSDDILAVLRAASPPENVRLQKMGAAVAASAVLTSSGTMSMHCALAGIPGAIAYRANWLTYLLGRMLVKIEYLGIANLLLNEPMYPEFIQGAATPAALAGQLRACRDEAARRARTAEQAGRLHALLRVPATGTAADWLARHVA
jgi:lipid-A-disaccharide synthase